MITVQLSECELNNIIQALESRKKKKVKRSESWERKKQVGLIVPLEVADSFITIDNYTANGVIQPLLERLESAKASFL